MKYQMCDEIKPTDEVGKSYDVVIRCQSQDSARRQLQWLDYYSIDAEIVEREVNADGISAAAPELLAALRKIRADLCRRHSPFVVEMDYAYINQAIAKATK